MDEQSNNRLSEWIGHITIQHSRIAPDQENKVVIDQLSKYWQSTDRQAECPDFNKLFVSIKCFGIVRSVLTDANHTDIDEHAVVEAAMEPAGLSINFRRFSALLNTD